MWEYPKDRPIERWDSPASHRLQMSASSSPVKALLGRLVVLATLHLLVPSLSWIFVGVAWTDTGQGGKALATYKATVEQSDEKQVEQSDEVREEQ